MRKQYLLFGKGLDLDEINFSSNEKGDLKTTISPLFGKEFLRENFSIINLSFICNSGSIEPDGIYRGSAKKDLQEETKKVKRISKPHSFTKLLIEAVIDLLKAWFFNLT